MNMFGKGKGSVKNFERRYLNSKQTGMTIDDFERDHLKNVVHAFYLCQDVTKQKFLSYQQAAMAEGETDQGDFDTMAAGFLVGINDAIHDPDCGFLVFEDLKIKQRDGWAHLIGDESRNIVGAVEVLCEYAKARNLSPSQVYAKFPREDYEREFAEYEKNHEEGDA